MMGLRFNPTQAGYRISDLYCTTNFRHLDNVLQPSLMLMLGLDSIWTVTACFTFQITFPIDPKYAAFNVNRLIPKPPPHPYQLTRRALRCHVLLSTPEGDFQREARGSINCLLQDTLVGILMICLDLWFVYIAG